MRLGQGLLQPHQDFVSEVVSTAFLPRPWTLAQSKPVGGRISKASDQQSEGDAFEAPVGNVRRATRRFAGR